MKKDTNNLQYGIYIDHKTAFVIAVDNLTVTTEEIRNAFAVSPHYAGETSSKTGMLGVTVSPQRRQQNKGNSDFRKFCKTVLAPLKRVNQVMLFGPADAKYELHKVMEEKKSLAQLYCRVKTTDKMNKADAVRFVKALYLS